MGSTPRLYLFHGSDSRASLQALHRWQEVFLNKYGIATRYSIDADELPIERVRQEVAQSVQGTSLFPEPKLVVIKRLEQHEKGRQGASTVAALLEEIKKNLDAAITVVFWSESALTEKSTIFTWFQEQQTLRLAKVTLYSVPSAQEVAQAAQLYLSKHQQKLEKNAAQWLSEQYRQQEKMQRLQLRLKAVDILVRDERAWWLYAVLDSASLLSQSELVTIEHLKQSAAELQAVSVFEITNAVRDSQWAQARTLLQAWEIEQESSDFFGLWSILRQQFRRLTDIPSRQHYAQSALQLFAEVELLSKNTQIPYPVLTDTLFLQLELCEKTGNPHTIVDARQLWLTTLPLS